MRVVLTQFCGQRILRYCILIRIEASNVCTQIWTSPTFDPYREIYIWLGKIRDSQLPARMIIDEEGRGVELFAERINSELVNFYIKPWASNNNDRTHLNTTLKSDELVSAFCNGILEFLGNNYCLPEWSNIDNLSNLNWRALLQPRNHADRKWETRLAIYQGKYRKIPNSERKCLEKSLTIDRQWLIVLYYALEKVALLGCSGQTYESYGFMSLYQNLLVDLILNEIDSDWYEERETEIEQGFTDLVKIFNRSRNPERIRLEI